MKFSELVDQAAALLQRKGRVSYRALKMEFNLDDEQLDALKEELLFSYLLMQEIDGRGLVWNAENDTTSSTTAPAAAPQPPASYTPAHLAERIRAEQAAMESRGAADGERKTITALFADLKGSTALIEGLDPEEARGIIDPALQLMMAAVHRYDGYVAQSLGDGIFALFGAPIAHEDHPERALYAALKMQADMRNYSDEQRLKGGVPLSMRVGINTGEVVVRSIRKDDLHTDYVPVGHSTNLASRMQEMATPGSILITEQTRKLTEGYFDLKSLGKAEVKGAGEPIAIYEVQGAGPLRTKLQVSQRRGLSRFVGRHSEMDQLQRALAQADEGHGQIVGVMGEVGLGKSRLFYEFKLISQDGWQVLESYSVSHGKASPYLPVIELLKSYFQVKLEDDERTRREKVIGKVLGLDRNLEETLPYLFAVLGIRDPKATLDQMDPQIRRQRTFNSLKNLILRESLNQPVMLIFEDLHWIDGETQGFLNVIVESIASARVALLVNYRPEYRHDWGGKTFYTQLRLTPLGDNEAREMLSFLMGDDASLGPLKALILERTDGTPFFIEEVVQTLAEEGVLLGDRAHYRIEQTPSALHISPTVQGILAARIDRLEPDEKTLLQQLSVIGRDFPLGLIREVVSNSEAELYRLLASLQSKEFLYEQPALSEVEYIFKHALTQDVAYGTVLQEQRRTLHEKTARAIEALRWSSLDDYYDELAHHYSKSGNTEKAVEYHRLAGLQAMRRSAIDEAIGHLSEAIALIQSLDDGTARQEQELALQTVLGTAHMLTKGYGAVAYGSAYARAHALCLQLGERPEVVDVLVGLWAFNLNGSETVDAAREISEELRQFADAQNVTTTVTVKALLPAFISYFYQGRLSAAREQTARLLAVYVPEMHHEPIVSTLGLDHGILAHCYDALALWLLGHAGQASASATAALTLADTLGHPNSSLWALIFAAMLNGWRGEPERAIEYAAEVTRVSQEHGLSKSMEAWGTLVGIGALADHDIDNDHVRDAVDALAILRTSGLGGFMPYHCTTMARIYGAAGRTDDALSVIDEGLDMNMQRAESWCEAELHRLKGEFIQHTAGGDPALATQHNAEICFEAALNAATKQGLKAWELRAASSLARLWGRQGKRSQAHTLLTEVYGGLSEGLDTKDPQDAKMLLRELA